jgi:type I restriction enzyme R subunit
VERVAKVETDPRGTQVQLSAAIAPVADRLLKRYKAALQARVTALVDGDDKGAASNKDVLDALILFKNDMGAYVRLYAFLSQVFDYGNTDRSASCSTSG